MIMTQKITTAKICALAAVLATCIALPAAAENEGKSGGGKHAIGSSINNFGLGVFYTYKFRDNLHLRTTYHGASADDADLDVSGNDYEGDLDSDAFGVMVDWYPMDNGWKRNIFVSAGVTSFDFEFKGNATSKLNDNIVIGSQVISPGEIGGLNVSVESDQVAPYLGLGWGNRRKGTRGFSFVAELGVLLVDDADVHLSVSAPLGSLTAENLSAEQDQIRNEFDSGLAGFASLGVSYHF
ncbi:MAG: hypothetical protein COA42_04780 [Alteromonadaceae bacterium]|nr:MAG: hypothetical protein COA42_04780 [Alteromonadaceae bacterium]